MKTSTDPNRIDRSKWPCGEWDAEPDRVEFEYAGFTCLLARGPAGAWCGYVAVLPGHPWHGKEYSDIDAEAHGGLTYSDKCQVGGLICHVTKPGEPDDVWWVGFDCIHSGDVAPRHLATNIAMDWPIIDGRFPETYKPMSYVIGWVRRLAEQARAAGSPS